MNAFIVETVLPYVPSPVRDFYSPDIKSGISNWVLKMIFPVALNPGSVIIAANVPKIAREMQIPGN
jgi:hypothetical protein